MRRRKESKSYPNVVTNTVESFHDADESITLAINKSSDGFLILGYFPRQKERVEKIHREWKWIGEVSSRDNLLTLLKRREERRGGIRSRNSEFQWIYLEFL